MKNIIRPTITVRSVADIDPEQFLKEYPEVKGISWDLDKTLTGQYDDEIPHDNLEIIRAFDELGVIQGIVSNAQSVARTRRVYRIAEKCHGVQMHVMTSMMADGRRKPRTPVFHGIAEQMGVSGRNIAHVGDQLLKDIVGANLAGFAVSVLVAPYGTGDVWGVRYVQRPIEVVLRPFVGAPLLTQNFGDKKAARPIQKTVPIEESV